MPVVLHRRRILTSKTNHNLDVEITKVVPLTCHGHSRPVTHLSFSAMTDDDTSYLISACKGECSAKLVPQMPNIEQITTQCSGMV